MPTIAVVEGVRITIHIDDHPPPHFHAEFAEHRAMISIATGDTLEGSLPRSKARLIDRWYHERRDVLAFLWWEFSHGRKPEGFTL